MPFSCAASSASAICRAMARASASGNGAAFETIGQRRSLDQFEDQRGHAIRFLQPVDRADVRVIERRERPRFAREAGAALGIGGEVRGQDLDRDVATELAVARAIDLAHAAGAERRHDRVGPEPTIDHRRRAGRSRGHAGGRALEEPRRRRLELEQRLHFLSQPVVSLARLGQERARAPPAPGPARAW